MTHRRDVARRDTSRVTRRARSKAGALRAHRKPVLAPRRADERPTTAHDRRSSLFLFVGEAGRFIGRIRERDEQILKSQPII
jgi:hypothetical protein